mgnify:CR=1 FL=1
MRKSITTRYFYATALLLIASTALMGFIQMYLSMVFFRAQSDADLLLTVDNTIQILQEVYGTTPDYDIAADGTRLEQQYFCGRCVRQNCVGKHAGQRGIY